MVLEKDREYRLDRRVRNEDALTRVKVDRNILTYEGWNFNSGNYLFTTDTK